MRAVDAIRADYRRDQELCRLHRENADLRAAVLFLTAAVDLLSMPRPTEADIAFVRNGLLMLQMPGTEVRM